MNLGIKLLVAEDDPNLGTILKAYLSQKGYTVFLAVDGQAALDSYQNDDVDACILDIMMPVKDGFTVAKEIRRVDNRIPIIFLTAKNLEADKLTVSVCSSESEETLFYTENYSEKVRMIECGLDYPGAPQDNICVKAYELLDADFQLPPAVIVLEKHIPVGAGLGGGSSDGVCTLRALNELCDLNLTETQLLDYAAKHGLLQTLEN